MLNGRWETLTGLRSQGRIVPQRGACKLRLFLGAGIYRDFILRWCCLGSLLIQVVYLVNDKSVIDCTA